MELLKRLTYKNLKLNKRRTIVTIVGITLAVALLTALSTLVSSFRASMIEAEKKYDGNFHYAFSNAKSEDVDDFINNRNIEQLYTLSNIGYAKVDGCKNEDKPYAFLCGTNEEGMRNLSFLLSEGRYPENENEILIPNHLKTNGRVEYKIGDKIMLSVGDRVSNGYELTQDNPYINSEEEGEEENEEIINTTQRTYTVVGISDRPSYIIEPHNAPGYTFVTYMEEPENDVTIFVRYTKKALKNRYNVTASILGVDKDLYKKVVSSEDELNDDDFRAFTEMMESAKYSVEENRYLVAYENVSGADQSLKVIYNMAIIVAIIIMVTSVFCIKNSFDISITEKTRQYGMLSSVGATKRQIRGSVLYEGFLLGVSGIPLGVILGLVASFILILICNYFLKDMLAMNLMLKISPIAIIIAVILGIVTIYLSSIGSAIKASRVSPIAAIRNHGDIRIKSRKIKAPKIISKIWGIGGVVSYKNIKRNKKKYRTTVVSIIICTTTFIVISYFMSMGFDLVKVVFGEVDYSLSLKIDNELVTDDIVNSIMNAENIDEKSHYQVVNLVFENCKETSQFEKYKDNDYIKKGENNISIVAMEEDDFVEFAREAGVSKKDCQGKSILINEAMVYIMNENTDKMVQAVIPLLDYEEGDVITSIEYFDKKYSFELAGVTDKRIMGYMDNSDARPYLVMSKSTMEKYEFDKERIVDNFFFTSDNTNDLQDNVEDILIESKFSDSDYNMYNVDEDMRQMNAIFITMAIFAYGLIGVIALIGITNIVNTINTSMQLRSREFATLRSVGMTKKEFNKMVRLESFFTGMKSLVIGVPAGLLLSYYIYSIEIETSAILPFRFPVKSVIICVLVVFGLLYGIMNMSLKNINKKNIIDTIKDENI